MIFCLLYLMKQKRKIITIIIRKIKITPRIILTEEIIQQILMTMELMTKTTTRTQVDLPSTQELPSSHHPHRIVLLGFFTKRQVFLDLEARRAKSKHKSTVI